MRSKFGLALLVTTLAGCNHVPYDLPDRGVEAVNVPVLQRSMYVFDAAAPGGYLAPSESARLDGWFRSLNLGYGDEVYVDGMDAAAARGDVERVAGQYGMLVSSGAPVTAGAVSPGTVRVVVSRTEATVPGCPNWERPSQPNFNNQSMPGYGCAVNGNLAAMVANPEDLVHGRDGAGVQDALTAAKAIDLYRTTPPTGQKGLKEISTKKGDK